MITESVLQTTYSSYASDSETNSDISSLDKDDFLTLLIAQLKNQDPLNPIDNTEFIAQLAQFSSLEQMTLVNENLDEMLESNTDMTDVVSNAMLINYIGKNVTAETDSFTYDGDNAIQLQFVIDSAASYGTLEITDSSGNIKKTVSLDALDEGNYYFEWDGITNLGIEAESGVYSYTIELYDSLGNEVDVSQIFTGVVESVSYIDGEQQLNIGGVFVPFDSVLNIAESK